MSIDRMKWLRENPAACVAPFTGISLRAHYEDREDIRYSCCCNLDVQVIAPGKQEDFFQSLKNDTRLGRKNQACDLCYRLESIGVISERMRYWLGYDDKSFQDLKNFENINTFEVKVKFSNLCPMACRSCSSGESSTYALTAQDHRVPNNIKSDFTDRENNFQEIQRMILDVESRYHSPSLHLIGGEPLVQDGCIKLMAWMVEQGIAEKFELRLTTSWAVNLSNDFLDLMRHFRRVLFLLSIDSVGNNYHYVRWPVKFTKIENNLKRLIEILPILKSSTINLIPVFSLNNIFYLPDFLDYFYSWIETYKTPIFISNQYLYDPHYLQIEILPDFYRSDLIARLEQCLNHPLVSRQHLLRVFLENTIDQLKNKSGNLGAFNDYLQHTAEFDVRTQTRFRDFNSRLYDQLIPEHLDFYNHCLSMADKNKSLNISIRDAANAYRKKI